MSNKRRLGGLYLILDQQYSKRDIVSVAIEAVEAGVDIIQYREKILSKREALGIARSLRNLTAKAGVSFVINDDPALALASDADGVHLGQEDIPVAIARKILGKDKLIGLSTHSFEEATAAGNLQVDYIGFGPIFQSKTKMVTLPHGIEGIRRIRAAISLPIIAIGGINQGNASEVIRAGADGAAVLSAVLSAPDIAKAVIELNKKLAVR